MSAKLKLVWIFLISSYFFIGLNGLTVSSTFGESDRVKIRKVFEKGLSGENPQLVSLALEGMMTLGEFVGRKREACELLKGACETGKDLESVYRGCTGLKHLGEGCDKPKVSDEVVSRLLDHTKAKNMESLSKIILTRVSLSLQTEISHLKTTINNLLKGSALDQAYANIIAVNIFTDKSELKRFWVEIEDTVQQADEIDGSYLFYEGGLITTARIVTSILNLADLYGEAPPSLLKGDKVVKFANFLLSRRHTQDLDAAVELIKALKALSKNKYSIPLVLYAVDNGVVDRHNPQLLLSFTNVWGDKIEETAEITAETVKNVQTAVTVINRKPAVKVISSGLYDLDMSTGKLDKGFYNIRFEIKMNDTKFNDITTANIVAKVISYISVEQVEISIKERDQVTQGSLNYKLTMNTLLADKLNINWHHRLEMKFVIKDDQQVFKPHQVFVKLTHLSSSQEIIFVAETDKTDSYKFILDLDKSNKDFDNLSGNYNMQLIVGDSVIKNPLQWTFANIKLDMPSSPSTDDVSDSRRSVAGMKKSPNPRIGQGPTVAKEQIFHIFRPADKRAGNFIAIIFTVLCTVPPLLIMFSLWGFIGINASNFEISLSSILFHVGLAVTFGLYYCYWSYLDMFSTLRCLIPLGAFTAFFGNRVLRHVAALRQKL